MTKVTYVDVPLLLVDAVEEEGEEEGEAIPLAASSAAESGPLGRTAEARLNAGLWRSATREEPVALRPSVAGLKHKRAPDVR